MSVDPETAIYNLMQTDPHIIAGAVLKGKEIIYTTDNWDISADKDRVISSWMGQNATFIMVSGVKYSVFQIETERLFAQSIKGEGSIIGAKNDEYKIICYMDPDGYGLGATMDVQRALSSLSPKTPYKDENAQLGQKVSQIGGTASAGGTAATTGGVGIDPQLQGEIKAFLDWVKQEEGLAGYISYYLQQNNAQIISELSKIYNELRQIFGV
ncbi:MAG: hypothetical protein ACW96X_11270 [Promethearchaeota archaeon]|jgi:hypothetical protein